MGGRSFGAAAEADIAGKDDDRIPVRFVVFQVFQDLLRPIHLFCPDAGPHICRKPPDDRPGPEHDVRFSEGRFQLFGAESVVTGSDAGKGDLPADISACEGCNDLHDPFQVPRPLPLPSLLLRVPDDDRRGAAFSGRLQLLRKAAGAAALFGQDRRSAGLPDHRRVHLFGKRALHGDDLLPGKAGFTALYKALLIGEDPGKYPGRILDPRGQRSEVLASREQEHRPVRFVDHGGGSVQVVDADEGGSIRAAGIDRFRRAQAAGSRIPGQSVTGDVRYFACGSDLCRSVDGERVRGVDHVCVGACPDTAGHLLRRHPADQQIALALVLLDLFPVSGRHADGMGNAHLAEPLRKEASLRSAAEDQKITLHFCTLLL